MEKREPVTQIMKASEARQQFSQLINRVFRGETRVIVEKSGIPVAAIISARDLELFDFLLQKREESFKVLDETWKAFEGVDPDEIEREVAKAVAEARKKLRKEAQRQAKAS